MRCVSADGAMDVKFAPNKSSLAVGEELRCTARGNPVPEVTLGPAALVKASRSGPGWSSLVVQPEWIGRTMTVQCVASNMVDEVKYSPTDNFTFNVTGAFLPITNTKHESRFLNTVTYRIFLFTTNIMKYICYHI